MGIDTTNVIVTLNSSYSTDGISWTATQDCWVVAMLTSKSGHAINLYLDGAMILRVCNEGQTTGKRIQGMTTFLIKKGQTISSTTGYNDVTAEITCYGLKI